MASFSLAIDVYIKPNTLNPHRMEFDTRPLRRPLRRGSYKYFFSVVYSFFFESPKISPTRNKNRPEPCRRRTFELLQPCTERRPVLSQGRPLASLISHACATLLQLLESLFDPRVACLQLFSEMENNRCNHQSKSPHRNGGRGVLSECSACVTRYLGGW